MLILAFHLSLFLSISPIQSLPSLNDPVQWLKTVPVGPAFSKVGESLGTKATASLVIDIDLAAVENTFKAVCNDPRMMDFQNRHSQASKSYNPSLPSYYAESIMAIAHRRCDHRYDHFIKAKTAWVSSYSTSRFYSPTRPQSLPHAIDTETYRNRRALGIIGFATSIYNTVELLRMNAEMEGVQVRLSVHEEILANNTWAIQLLNGQIDWISRKVDYLGLEMEQVGAAVSWVSVLEEIFTLMDKFELGFLQLSNRKLSPILIDPTMISSAVDELRHKMEEQGYELLVESLEDVYSSETSHVLYANMTLRTFVHLPGSKRRGEMEVFKYIPMPLQIKDQLLLPVPPTSYLVLSKDRTQSREMTSSLFSLCQTTKTFLDCPQSSIYDKRVGSSCLLAMYRGNDADIIRLCEWSRQPVTDHLEQIGPNSFLLYQTVLGEVTLRCKGDRYPSRFSGLRRVEVPPGCTVTSDSFIFEGQLDVVSEPRLLEIVPLNLTELSVILDGEAPGWESAWESFSGSPVPRQSTLSDFKASEDRRFWVRLLRFFAILFPVLIILSFLGWGCLCSHARLREYVIAKWDHLHQVSAVPSGEGESEVDGKEFS